MVSAFTDPTNWRIPSDASEGTVSMNTSAGPRVLCALPSLHGSFYLRPTGLLAGFSLRLPLPVRPTRLRAGEPAELLWESVDLWAGLAPDEVAGRARLRLGRRETYMSVSGRCAEIPAARPYLKIVLEAAFSPLSLRWPLEARLRPVVLRVFSEIRPSGAGRG